MRAERGETLGQEMRPGWTLDPRAGDEARLDPGPSGGEMKHEMRREGFVRRGPKEPRARD